MLSKRNFTHPVKVGSLVFGGDNLVSIQSMTTTRTKDVTATVAQIHALEKEGVEVIRVAVPDLASMHALEAIKERIGVPLVADIHFDCSLAMQSLDKPIDLLRLNPGNIGGLENFSKIVAKAKQRNIPLRLGVNAGSLEKEILKKWGLSSAAAMVEQTLKYIAIIQKLSFENIVLSLKSADVKTTIEAYKIIAGKTTYPLHIGITEAGTYMRGTIKSAIGLGYLLLEGIGDTLRVSLTADPLEEVKVAKEILQATGVRKFGPEIISCPTCGRCNIDLIPLVQLVEEKVATLKEPVKIAVMGCAVNGPGEARQADFGVAGGQGEGLVFRKGQVVKKVAEKDLVDTLIKIIKQSTNWE